MSVVRANERLAQYSTRRFHTLSTHCAGPSDALANTAETSIAPAVNEAGQSDDFAVSEDGSSKAVSEDALRLNKRTLVEANEGKGQHELKDAI